MSFGAMNAIILLVGAVYMATGFTVGPLPVSRGSLAACRQGASVAVHEVAATARASRRGRVWVGRGHTRTVSRVFMAADSEDGAAESAVDVDGAVEAEVDAVPDLAKQIDFEAPQAPQAGDETDPKQVRVLLYVLLSLIPCLLLIPFMANDQLVPLDPSQMQ